MISTLVFLLAASLTAGYVVFAYFEWRKASEFAQSLQSELERFTETDEVVDHKAPPISEIGQLVMEALQDEDGALAVVAARELASNGQLLRARIFAIARGLARVTLLTGGAGGFSVLALGGFGRSSVILAVTLVFFGIVASFLCQAFLSRARKQVARYVEVTSVLGKEVGERVRAGPEGEPPKSERF